MSVVPACLFDVALCDAPEGGQRWVTGLTAEPRLRRSLEDLGFVAGAEVSVVRRVRGDVIVRLGDSRIAVGQDCAQSIRTASSQVGSLSDVG